MIPTYLEKLIHEGAAEFKSHSHYLGQQLAIECPKDCYLVLYEYWYKPPTPFEGLEPGALTASYNWADFINYVHFFTGANYFPFFHKLTMNHDQIAGTWTGEDATTNPPVSGNRVVSSVYTDYRKCYIVSGSDVAIHFTRLNNELITTNSVALANYKNLLQGINYGGLTVTDLYDNFNSQTAGDATGCLPAEYYTQFLVGAGFPNFIQAFSSVDGGEMDPAAYTNSGYALDKTRGLYFHVNYIQVNQPLPKRLK